MAPVEAVSAAIGLPSLLRIIESATESEAISAAKLDSLLAMHDRLIEKMSREAFTAGLAALQSELPVIAERGVIPAKGRGGRPYTYALWEDINEEIKPLLARCGFALSFKTGQDGAAVRVTGVLSHKGGHSEETTMSLPVDLTGSKNAVQAIGSSTSYGKRYVTQALLNLTSRGEDDDGIAAVSEPTILEDELASLEELIRETGASRAKLLSYLEIEVLSDLPRTKFEHAVAVLEAKRGRV
ncbi:ERF family protein [Flaviflagellibacter deserti]|uniref:ERF family protein n=1 Tax=Flaviflagellibacter deserti TaxID=2267266 RepID=A0ABV9Z0T6_9HYPH